MIIILMSRVCHPISSGGFPTLGSALCEISLKLISTSQSIGGLKRLLIFVVGEAFNSIMTLSEGKYF